MSNILEKKGKGKLDDTIPLKCSIESFATVDDHTVSFFKNNSLKLLKYYC